MVRVARTLARNGPNGSQGTPPENSAAAEHDADVDAVHGLLGEHVGERPMLGVLPVATGEVEGAEIRRTPRILMCVLPPVPDR
jgi:hypothetical protein